MRPETPSSDEAAPHTPMEVQDPSLLEFNLDDFERLRLIGQGDVGTVYLVRQRSTGKLFAMKVMAKADMISRNKIHRVCSEREILATAAHPFILSLYGSFQDDKRLYLLTDWCPGGEFWRILQRMPNKRFPEHYVRFYAAEILLALEYLHTQGVVYRDLKCENVLLQQNGHLCLADFDLSKMLPVDLRLVKVQPKRRFKFSLRKGLRRESSFTVYSTGSSAFESTNSFVGTAEYLAPEVIGGKGHTNTVDFWTLGILIYELLYGVAPFGTARGDRQALFNAITKGRLVFPDHPHISSAARSLIRKLLVANPNKRLGAKYGAEEIKRHSFFKGLDFSSIAGQVPPLKPATVSPEDIQADPNLNQRWSETDTRTGKDVSPHQRISEENYVDPFAAFGVNVERMPSEENDAPSQSSFTQTAPTTTQTPEDSEDLEDQLSNTVTVIQ